MATAFPSEGTAKDAVRVWSLVQSIKIGMLSGRTLSFAGSAVGVCPLRGRFEEHPDAIWFIVSRSFASAPDSQAGEVLLSFSNGTEGEHVALLGKLSVVLDRNKLKSLWDAHADIEFPQGAEDPAATLLKFEPRIAEFWTDGGLISFIVDFLETKFTGEPHRSGDHGVVTP